MTTDRTALDLAAAIRAKELSPAEAMDDTLAAIEARNGTLNAIVWLDADDARARANAATDRVAQDGTDDLPPFFGVPIPIKDLYDVAGWPNTYGSPGGSDQAVPGSGLVVERLVDAGFILCGRSNTPEFGTITATENDRYGITRNPWNTDHTSGGSSGGASAAVAGDLFTIAHASDGGGSIRIPASCTGLVGLKAARGRVVDHTVSWEGASTQGVVSRTVADTAAVLDAIAKPDPLAWWNAPPPSRPFADEVGADPGRLRIAVSLDVPMGLPLDPECATAARKLVDALAGAGHELVETRFDPHIESFVAHFGEVVNASLTDPVDWNAVQPYNQHGRSQGQAVDSVAYTEAIAALQLWTRAVNAQWGRDFDLLVTPTMSIQPPRAGEMLRMITENPGEVPGLVLQTVLFTSLFNMNGLPAISLPIHQAADSNLPIGAQIVAGPWQEASLLRVAAQVEQLLPWADRRPDVAATG